MKSLILILSLQASFCFAQDANLILADVPRDVLKCFLELYPEHSDGSVWSKNSSKHYVVHTEVNNHKIMAVFRDDGSLVFSEEAISYDEVSDSAKQFFTEHNPGNTVTYCNRLKLPKDHEIEMICGYSNPDPTDESCMPFPNYTPGINLAEVEHFK